MSLINDFKFNTWQKAVFDSIEAHDDFANTERMQMLSNIERNRATSIHVKMPVEYGHSTFAV